MLKASETLRPIDFEWGDGQTVSGCVEVLLTDDVQKSSVSEGPTWVSANQIKERVRVSGNGLTVQSKNAGLWNPWVSKRKKKNFNK